MKKSFRISDLCKLNSLNGVIVLSGEEHLDHEVERINVMEVPDIENWVQKNEFLMTTGYMYMDTPEMFSTLIPKLKEKNVAALGIKTKRFLEDIPQSVIECAKSYDFPLLLLPEQTTFSLVIRECMERILMSEKEQVSTFLNRFLTGKYSNTNELLDIASRLNLKYHRDTLFTVLLIAEKDDHVIYEKEALYSNIKTHFRSANFECDHVMDNNHLIILLYYQDPLQIEKLDACHKEIIPLLKEYNGIMCEYERNATIDQIPKVYDSLKKMGKVVETCNIRGFWVCFNELGIYSAIPEMQDSLFNYFCRSKYIDPLIAYDQSHGSQLIETLKAFFDCNCNMRETAQKMYTHYNTICHRIDKIQEILNIDLHDFHNQCTLYISIILTTNN